MVVDNNNDLIPTNFIIKVFETKELAEANDDNNALRVFNNAIDGDGADPRVANGSQYIDGLTSGDGSGTAKLIDLEAKFGTPYDTTNRLVGKVVSNTTDGSKHNITAVDSETQLTLTAVDGGTAGIAASKQYHIIAPGPYFIFHKYYYRIESTDPVTGFVIDWDDGEDNSPEKANRQTIKLDSPQYHAIVEHTYTHHGVHYPMVRTISPEGFFSKWYVSHDATTAVSSGGTVVGLKSIEPQSLNEGQNDFSIVSADLEQGAGTLCRMPEFSPASMPPIGVLKLDRTSVYSGIDNSVIPLTEAGVDPKGYAFVYRSGGTLTAMDGSDASNTGALEIIYRTSTDRIIKETVNPHSTAAHADALFPSTTADGFLKEILSVKLIELREGTITSTDRLGPDERVFIKVYDSDGDTASATTDDTITIVSLGNPIQTLDRPGFSVFADGSQSQTRASNVSISKYWFEDGKLSGTTRQGPSLPNISDAFDVTDDFDQTESNLRSYYTFDTKNHVIDATLKTFPDEERLYRLQVEDSSADTRTDSTSPADGRSGDTCVKSFIEHWDSSSFQDDLNRPSSLFSRALLLYGNLPYGAAVGSTVVCWSNASDKNAINSGSASAPNGDPYLVFGGSRHADSGSANTNDTQLTGGPGAEDALPSNWLLCCKTDKFNKIHLRMDNNFADTAALGGNDSDWFNLSDPAGYKFNIEAWYTAKTSKIAAGYIWKPLPIVDGTSIGDFHTSLRRSGSITFEMPDDWVSIESSDLGANWAGPISDDSTVSGSSASDATQDPAGLWTEDMYGLLIGIAANFGSGVEGRLAYWKCASVIPYNNSHSQAIKIVDPHHKSLNDIAFAQNISWNRAGKYVQITDRLGRAEVRRIGAEGGTVSFGGVELGGTTYTTSKAALSRYQRKGTPVYLDVERKNGDFIRIYGVITSMSEDYPTGKALPKFGLSMQVEYIVEYDSNGDWISNGLMALGGEIIDEPKYLL